MTIAVVYDCLYPYTVGGAERWYGELARRLAEEGHQVTYLTLRQWSRGEHADLTGVDVVAVGPRMRLYARGRRRIVPPLVFGAGLLVHLVRRGGRYDVVHTASFPYFSLLAASAARSLHSFRLFVDWFEVWTRDYWREYLGSLGGRVGWLVQRLCARRNQQAFCFSRLHAARVRELGVPHVTVLDGLYAGSRRPPAVEPSEPVVVFAGRHIPEKRVPALVPAVQRARGRLPELRCEIYGDGPERPRLLRLIAERGLDGSIRAPGFVAGEELEQALRRALCLVLPSRREGYGLIVIEAAALGTPSVVVRGPDNAATELIEEGRNGFVAESADPGELSEAILAVHAAGTALRASTAEWFERNATRLAVESSLEKVVAAYSAG